MKKTKQLAAVLLSLVMLLALAIPAAAADTYSITIQNNKTGHIYEAYQIFAGTVSSDDPTAGNEEGPMLGDITWGSGVDGAALLTALQAANAGKYGECTTAAEVAKALGAETATAADAAAFAKIAALHLTNVEGTATEPVEGNYVINNLAAGYYLVKDKDGSLEGDADTATEYIVQVLGNVAMEPKSSDIPTVEKKVSEEDYHEDDGYGAGYNDVADWDIGDSVPFKLIGSIPDMSAYNTYKYIFTDTLSNGLTLQADTIKVYIAHEKNDEVRDYTPLTAGVNYTLTTTNTENGGGSFSIAFEDLKTAPYMNEGDRHFVIVTYDATLNANAEIGLPGNPNEVYLEFSNDPNGDGLGRTAEDTVIVFTYELDGTKVDGANEDTKLEGAEFVLFNGGYTRVARVVNGKLVGWVEPDDIKEGLTGTTDREKMNELTNEDFANAGLAITSDADGAFNIAGLDDGTYYLREIQAPNGYNLLEGDVQLVIEATTANGQTWNGTAAAALTALNMTFNVVDAEEAPTEVEGVLEGGTVGITVKNNQGATLPETGGMGTTLFYIIGGLLVVGAGILLVVRIRMKAHNE